MVVGGGAGVVVVVVVVFFLVMRMVTVPRVRGPVHGCDVVPGLSLEIGKQITDLVLYRSGVPRPPPPEGFGLAFPFPTSYWSRLKVELVQPILSGHDIDSFLFANLETVVVVLAAVLDVGRAVVDVGTGTVSTNSWSVMRTSAQARNCSLQRWKIKTPTSTEIIHLESPLKKSLRQP